MDALFAGDLQPITTMTLRTLGVISFTGPPRWTYSIRGVSLFNWVTAVFFYAGFIMTLWRIRRAHYSFILAWLLVGILPSAITTHAPSIIRMIGAAPIFYLMPGIAIAVISKRIENRYNWQFSYLLLLIPYLLFLSFHTISNGFVAWPNSEITREKYQTILLEMGRHWEANAKGNMVVMQNFYEPIEADTMRRNMGYDVSSRWAQTGPNIAGALVLPHAGYLYVPEYASPPLDLILAAGVDPQPLYRSEKLPSFAVYALDQSINIPVLIQPVQFDNKISLLGYGIGKQTDTQYQLFTYWRVESPLPEDLATFLHLIDADGNLFSQHDGLDVAAATLSPQDIIVQHHLIPLSAPLPTRYSLQIGLYTRTNNVRLLHDGQSADRFILQELP
ncbi:MAG: hypothetical protein GY943_21715 [Chloroflexi bacterium]|nr:hypothetical protein [Chloroflexota bacterium]